jgi:hypothetical protein
MRYVQRDASLKANFLARLWLPAKEIVPGFGDSPHTHQSFDWIRGREIHEGDSREPCGFL